MTCHQKARRGIILMIVLSLLAVFTLVAVMFVLVSSQFADASRRSLRQSQIKKDGASIAEDALFSLLRGTRVPTAFTFHDLLGDLYSQNSIRCVVTRADVDELEGQFFVLAIRSPQLSKVDDYYNGQVITFLDGPYARRSSRIVRYSFVNNLGIVGFEAFSDAPNGRFANSVALQASMAGTTVLINGGICNGAGAGFDSTTGKLDSFIHFDRGPDGQYGVANVDDDQSGTPDDNPIEARGDCDDLKLPVALLPNLTGYPAQPTFPYHLGGVNEDYDAPDFQNMFLAQLPADPSRPPAIIPSFHRPHLINYWMNWVGEYILGRAPYNIPSGNWRAVFASPSGFGLSPQHVNLIVAIKRSILFRPVQEDHPNFNGSNPNFGYFGIGAPNLYDVDNDGDGKPDSIWIDFGLPARSTPDGRKFKALIAPLIIDLDGRLNLNVHGQLAHRPGGVSLWHPGPDGIWGEPGDDNNNGTPNDITEAGMDDPATPYRTDDIAIAPNRVPSKPLIGRGFGYGPAEVSLAPLFGGTSATPAQLLEYGSLLSARYTSRSGRTIAGMSNGFNDIRGVISRHELPQAYPFTTFPFTPVSRLGAYGTPSDILGLGGIALHYNGAPDPRGMGIVNESVDDPYEFLATPLGTDRVGSVSPGRDGAWGRFNVNDNGLGATDDIGEAGWPGSDDRDGDVPYTIADLEALLRRFDDGVARRGNTLTSIAPTTFGGTNSQFARSVTTHSSHIPTLNTTFLGESRSGISSPHFIDILRNRLTNAAQTSKQMRMMLPFELFRGELFDVNRPFGNGRDDDLDLIVDERDEHFGNGVDDDGDGLVDEHDELNVSWNDPQLRGSTFFRAEQFVTPPPRYTPPALRFGGEFGRNDDWLENSDPRQIYARNLYVLAMLVKGRHFNQATNTFLNSEFDFDGDNSNNDAETARVLAQWAVNVVDFRDADSIMTAFEYDENPFDGWDVDGNPATIETKTNTKGEPIRGLVFGCERPELLLTESLAFHSRRTEDLSNPANKTTDMPNGDPNSDQRLMPRGSLFLELYNPWKDQFGTNAAGQPGGFVRPSEFYYDSATSQWSAGVKLDKLTPVGNSPVWRVLIVKGNNKNSNPDDPKVRPVSTDIERSVYFVVPTNVPNDGRAGKAYSILNINSTPVAPITPGQYAVIGPRGNYTTNVNIPGAGNVTGYISTVGRRKDSDDTVPNGVKYLTTRRITLLPHTDPNFSRVFVDDNQTPTLIPDKADPLSPPVASLSTQVTFPQDVRNAVGIVVDNLSISEPVNGYPRTTPGPAGEIWNPTLADNDGAYLPPLDVSLDERLSRGKPEFEAVFENGTTANYRMIHLQRLADPTLPWNPLSGDPGHDSNRQVNPYLTIDSLSVSLTAFNGVVDDKDFARADKIKLNGDPMSMGNRAFYGFRSLQRGDADTANRRSLWGYENPEPDATTNSPKERWPAFPAPPGPQTHVFDYHLSNSLGYLNHGHWPYHIGGPFGGEPRTLDNNGNVAKNPKNNGDSTNYFPWLTWNNRPFATPLELMQVPRSSSFSLTRDFARTTFPVGANEVYDDKTQAYGHLLNFFWSKPKTIPPNSTTDVPSRLFRIFDLLTTTNPFPDSYKSYNPLPFYFDKGNDGFWGNANTDDDGNGILNDILEAGYGDDRILPNPGVDGVWGTSANDDGQQPTNDFLEAGWPGSDDVLGPFSAWAFRPPFNRLSRFRDPGRVNLNTMPYSWTPGGDGGWGTVNFDDDGNGMPDDETEAGWPGSDDRYQSYVWDGLTYMARTQPDFTQLFRSFEGFNLSNTNRFPAGAYPTHLARPFRSAAASDLVPNTVPPLVPPLPPASPPPVRPWPSALSRDDESLATLLRPDPANPMQPILAEPASVPSASAATDPNRNPFYRYHSIQRLHNLVTSHSNVFAVWITVGYFEVTDWPGGPDARHPDGLQLGRELGWDSGDARRHRSFYVIDRSIPVGYEPGQDHNVGDCIVLRRHLE